MLDNLESVYNVEHYRSKTHLLLTNTASNTAVRAPGLIQALAVTETINDALAGAISPGRHCHSTLPLAAIGCHC